jgi:hypothetical protein
VQKPSKGKPDN